MCTCGCENKALKDEGLDTKTCECGCEFILISATDKRQKKGVCERCRKDVDLTGSRIFLTR